MSAATQNEMERLIDERDSAVEQVAYWRERALDAEGRENALAAHVEAGKELLSLRYPGAELFQWVKSSPKTSLARLIAEKQADAVYEYAFHYLGGHEQELAEIYAGKLRRKAEEPTVCPGPGKCDDPGCPAHYAMGGE